MAGGSGGGVLEGTSRPAPPAAPRTKSKTGCKTCKIRRVRCGEERPACRRCVSTGRICDGYGIWGGGGNAYGSRGLGSKVRQLPPTTHRHAEQTKHLLTSARMCSDSPVASFDAEETFHFQWFWRRTARKISGAFFSVGGNALFFQACASDKAVTHAVLAICAAHRLSDQAGLAKEPLGGSTLARREEWFALRQYNKSIRELQRHLRAEDAMSLRIALFSCLAFVFVELFRSHYQAAARHLEHGLKILEQAANLPGANGFAGRPIDDWVRGAFRKLFVQSTLFGQRPRHPWPFVVEPEPLSKITIFASAQEARDYLENILLSISGVIERKSHPNPVKIGSPEDARDLIEEIKTDLDFWLLAYENTVALLELRLDRVEAFACRMLRMYHTMCTIMADTACETAETKYDRHTSDFLSVMDQYLLLRKVAANSKLREKYFGTEEGISHSIGDMGPVAPLYYVALHCRVCRLRLQAIRLLEEMPRKEGIYDAILVANIARKVMDLEWEGSPDIDVSNDRLSLSKCPVEDDFMFDPLPPEVQRVQILDVVLPDGAWNAVVLRCRQQNAVICCKVDHTLSADSWGESPLQ